jgi:hypothetical protein
MTVFRWIIGVLTVLIGGGWLFTLLLFVMNGDDRFKELGTRLRRLTFTIVLFWFNIEIWGRVVWTIFTWNRPPSA